MKKILSAIISIVILGAILSACQSSAYSVSVSVRDDVGGHVTGGGYFRTDEEVMVVATPEDGYIFDGWYDEEGSKLSEERSYSFLMTDEDFSLTAIFSVCSRHELDGCACVLCNSAVHDLNEYCYCARCKQACHLLDENCKCKTCGRTYHSLNANECVCSVCQSPVHIPDDDCVCSVCGNVAHRPGEDCTCKTCGKEAHNVDGNCVCKTCGEVSHGHKNGLYCTHRDDDLCYFGQYPQSEVTDEALTSSLNDAAGALPTASDLGNWTIMDNYYSGEVSDCAYYTDLELDGKKYRGVYFTAYRSHYVGESTADNQSFQYRNGYHTDAVYWFQYEPVSWRILESIDGEARLFCSIALDCMQFADSLTPYETDEWCSKLYVTTIDGYNGTEVNISYDDCNPFGMIAGHFGEITEIPQHSYTASESITEGFNSLGKLFDDFTDDFDIPRDGTEYAPTVDGASSDKYTEFYNEAIRLYNDFSLVSFTQNLNNNLSDSAVIGANYPYTLLFGSDVTPDLVDFQTVIAKLFGFNSKTEFMDYAQSLADIYADYNPADNSEDNKKYLALINGCFYSKNDNEEKNVKEYSSFIFPIAIKNESSPVLTYVIIDDNGLVSVWINDVTSALKATNYNGSHYTDGIINNEFYCKNMLFIIGPRHSVIKPSNYRYSDINEWLNDTFFKTAFSDAERRIMQRRIALNGDYSGVGTSYVSILSKKYLTSLNYGYKDSLADEDALRIKTCSDYAACMGIRRDDNGYCCYWVRNAFVTHDNYLYCSYVDGKISNARRADDSGTGVAPTIIISIK